MVLFLYIFVSKQKKIMSNKYLRNKNKAISMLLRTTEEVFSFLCMHEIVIIELIGTIQ